MGYWPTVGAKPLDIAQDFYFCMLMDWDTVKVHMCQKALLQMQNKFTKPINTLGFFVFIIFEDFSLLFSELMVYQR